MEREEQVTDSYLPSAGEGLYVCQERKHTKPLKAFVKNEFVKNE
jgi:hypothetical protein